MYRGGVLAVGDRLVGHSKSVLEPGQRRRGGLRHPHANDRDRNGLGDVVDVQDHRGVVRRIRPL